MKKLWLLGLLVSCMACDEDYSVDPTILPSATTTGENTIGCVIDGWVYSSKRFGEASISTYAVEEGDSVAIHARVGNSDYLEFGFCSPEAGKSLPYTDVLLNGERQDAGSVTITRMGNGVLSGTFEGGNVIHGRFDMEYSY